jgi:hypothetical protein
MRHSRPWTAAGLTSSIGGTWTCRFAGPSGAQSHNPPTSDLDSSLRDLPTVPGPTLRGVPAAHSRNDYDIHIQLELGPTARPLNHQPLE